MPLRLEDRLSCIHAVDTEKDRAVLAVVVISTGFGGVRIDVAFIVDAPDVLARGVDLGHFDLVGPVALRAEVGPLDNVVVDEADGADTHGCKL